MAQQQKKTTTTILHTRIKGMFIALGIEYVFGMFINLFNTSDDPAKKTLIEHIGFFGHVLIALFLLIGSFFILALGRKAGDSLVKKLTRSGCIGICLAFTGGVITVVGKGMVSELGSFLMALSFLVAFSCYGFLFFRLQNK